MAARRFVKSSIDWAAFAERVPAHEKKKFQQFKAKVDNYTKNLMSLPEKPPAINFALYRSRLPNQAMVAEFEKQTTIVKHVWFLAVSLQSKLLKEEKYAIKYNAVKVPYPADKLTPQIDEQEKQALTQIKEFNEFSDLKIKVLNKYVDWYAKMMPFEEMSMDDFYDYYPDHPENMYKYPNFWPHTEPPRPVFPYLEKKDEH